ncbi:MAG: glycosyltransferase family 4 protein [Candidatus Marinimicrobia bacterium]|nr:glycosyltransferase family 4 protein [Candidatus Neomarinimicrobiota bacterium]
MRDRKKKIIIVSQYFPPETGAASSRMGDLSKQLSLDNYEVTVLTEIPNYPEGKITNGYSLGLLKREKVGTVQVFRSFVLPTKRRNFLERAIFYVSFFLGTLINSFRLPAADIVMGTSPSPLTALSAWFIARIKGAKFVLDIRDLWPASIISLTHMKSGLVVFVLKKLEKFLYNRADLISLAVPGFREHIIGVVDKPKNYIDLLNGAPDEFFEVEESNISIEGLPNLDGKFVVFFSGNHGIAQATDTLIKAAEKLKESDKIHFLFVGNGICKPAMIKLSKESGLTNTTFIGSQPRKKMPHIIDMASLCVVPLRRLPIFEHAMPSKMFEYMARGKPIILSVLGEAKTLLEESGGGICIEPENHKELADTILTLYENSEMASQLGKNGKEFVRNNYRKSVIIENFSKALKEV